MPDSVYTWFDIVSNTCHPAPCYLNGDKVFLLLSDQYHNPESVSECLLEFDTHSKPLGHHGRFYVMNIYLHFTLKEFIDRFNQLYSIQLFIEVSLFDKMYFCLGSQCYSHFPSCLWTSSIATCFIWWIGDIHGYRKVMTKLNDEDIRKIIWRTQILAY